MAQIREKATFVFDRGQEFEADRTVYELALSRQPDQILGLMSLSDVKKEFRIHLHLPSH